MVSSREKWVPDKETWILQDVVTNNKITRMYQASDRWFPEPSLRETMEYACLDVHNYTEANCDSDHFMLRARFTVR